MSISGGIRVMLALRWGDQDAYGHVNSVALLRLLEEARVRILCSSGILPALQPDQPTWSLVTDLQIRYRRVLGYGPDPVAVEVGVLRVGAASVGLGYRVTTGDGTILHATASTTIVFVDRGSSALRRLTPKQKGLLAGLQIDGTSVLGPSPV